ncbi:MAG: right-handed parallel beta-helix repeat-containing protein [Candidatus Limnocylindrales bacterium]
MTDPRQRTEVPTIRRHLLARLVGIAVILTVAAVGLGAGLLTPRQPSGQADASTPPTAPAPSTPPVTPPAPTPVPTAADRYLAPGGSDTAAGTMDAPWATLAGAMARLRPGETLWVRNGRYVAGETDWMVSGTAGAKITIRGYPGEQPVFDGNGSEDKFLWFHGGASWITLSDIRITGYKAVETGVIALSEGAHDITLSSVEIDGNRAGTPQDHLVYLSAPDVHDVTIQDCLLTGASGAAIHVYHEPAAHAIQIVDNQIQDSHWGVLLYSGTSDVTVSGNQFTDVDVALKLERATNVTLLDNTATGGFGIEIVGPPFGAQYVEQGNAWPAPVQTVAP